MTLPLTVRCAYFVCKEAVALAVYDQPPDAITERPHLPLSNLQPLALSRTISQLSLLIRTYNTLCLVCGYSSTCLRAAHLSPKTAAATHIAFDSQIVSARAQVPTSALRQGPPTPCTLPILSETLVTPRRTFSGRSTLLKIGVGTPKSPPSIPGPSRCQIYWDTASEKRYFSSAILTSATRRHEHITTALPDSTVSHSQGATRPTTTRHMRSTSNSPSSRTRLLSTTTFPNPTFNSGTSSTIATRKMSPRVSDRSMPAVSSPLSPRSEPLAIPSQAPRRPGLNSRQSSSSPGHLKLPSLPRFHPANFASSQSSSHAATPVTGPNSPHSPASPRTAASRQYEAQRQMYLYQQQLLTNTSRQVRSAGGLKPTSPRLAPLASPGAVTPLELTDADSYLTAGVNPNDAARHVEKLISKEARRGEYTPVSTSVGGR